MRRRLHLIFSVVFFSLLIFRLHQPQLSSLALSLFLLIVLLNVFAWLQECQIIDSFFFFYFLSARARVHVPVLTTRSQTCIAAQTGLSASFCLCYFPTASLRARVALRVPFHPNNSANSTNPQKRALSFRFCASGLESPFFVYSHIYTYAHVRFRHYLAHAIQTHTNIH
jgi:hypothetical protein